jgi:hypothetical protein
MSSATRLAARAEGALGQDRDGYRAEFVELVRSYAARTAYAGDE